MDTFEALVRLDAAGWQTLPARPEQAGSLPGELARLVKRAGGLSREGQRFDFTSTEEPPSWLAPGVGFRRLLAPDTALLGVGQALWVVRFRSEPHTLELLAPSLGDWLAGLLAEAGAGRRVAPEPLSDLAFDGEGWGWDVESLPWPCVLDLRGLPTDLLDQVVHVDERCIWVGERIGTLAPRPAAVIEEEEQTGPDLDELFGAGGGRARPRSALIGTLLVIGLFFTVIGMACINAPGGLLVLVAWMLVEKDLERLESGYLPASDREQIERMRSLTYGGLLLVVVLFVLQGLLLCNGFYDVLLDQVYIPWWRSFFTGEVG